MCIWKYINVKIQVTDSDFIKCGLRTIKKYKLTISFLQPKTLPLSLSFPGRFPKFKEILRMNDLGHWIKLLGIDWVFIAGAIEGC